MNITATLKTTTGLASRTASPAGMIEMLVIGHVGILHVTYLHILNIVYEIDSSCDLNHYTDMHAHYNYTLPHAQ